MLSFYLFFKTFAIIKQGIIKTKNGIEYKSPTVHGALVPGVKTTAKQLYTTNNAIKTDNTIEIINKTLLNFFITLFLQLR